MSKLPPSGSVDIEIFNGKVVLSIHRDDGRKQAISLTLKELENLVEYIRNIIDIAKKEPVIYDTYTERYYHGGTA